MNSEISFQDGDFEGILENEKYQELAERAFQNLEKEVHVPFVMKDKILMSPGVWNNFYYDKNAIQQAFENTEWSQKNRALFLDHVDDRASEWIGEVTNIRWESGNLLGDLVIVDKPTAIKLAYGAKFGVSPKVVGEADWNRRIHDFQFENFSIVINPAVKTTYLNQQIKFGGKEMKTEKELQDAETEEENDSSEEATNKTSEEESKEQTAELKEETKIDIKKLAEEVAEILAKKKKYPYPEENKKKYPEEGKYPKPKSEASEESLAKKKKYPYPEEGAYPKKQDEMSDDDFEAFLEETITNSNWTDFVAKYIKEHKGEAPVTTLMKRAAIEFKKKASETPKMEEVAIKKMTTEEIEDVAKKVVETKMAEIQDPGLPIATKFLNIPSEKQTDGDVDRAVCELLGRFAV